MAPSHECNLPNNTIELPDSKGRTDFTIMHVPELDFPRKIETEKVLIWYGSQYHGMYDSSEWEIWLLAPNIIKLDNGKFCYVLYNVTIELRCPSQRNNK